MIRAQRLPEALGKLLNDGIYGAIVMSTEGGVVSSAMNKEEANLSENEFAVATTLAWSNYTHGHKDASVSVALLKMDNALMGIAAISPLYIIALIGHIDCEAGMLRGKLVSTASHFSQMFDSINEYSGQK